MEKPIRRSPSQPRKRPVQARSVATVTAILDAAAHILETYGPSAYSTNAVAVDAGVSIGSVYQYFPTKDAITRALIDRETGVLLAGIERSVGSTHGEAALRSLIQVAIHHQLRRPALGRFLDYEEGRLPMSDDMAEAANKAKAILMQCLEESGDGDTSLTAADIMSIIKGMVDGASQRNETDEAALQRRVEASVFGYLLLLGNAPGASVS